MLSPPILKINPSVHAIVLVTGSIILPRSGPNTLSAADWQRHNGPLLPTWWSAQTSDGDGNRGVVASPPKAWGDKCLHLDLKTLILCFGIILHRILGYCWWKWCCSIPGRPSPAPGTPVPPSGWNILLIKHIQVLICCQISPSFGFCSNISWPSASASAAWSSWGWRRRSTDPT